MADVHQFPPPSNGRVELGPEARGQAVIVDGRHVPNLVARDNGEEIEFVLDGRLAYSVPADISAQFASAIANAMAIGAGWPSISAEAKAPFAPRVFKIG